MKPETRTVTQLFELDVRYVVPLYQRPYVWDDEQQWEPLWDDVVTLVEHQENGNGQLYSHFLGAIVLDQTTPVPGKIPVFTVIDGQQRLTTLQIFLAAAANVADELCAENDAGVMRDLVRNNERSAAGIELFKVWPTNANRKAFEAVMANGGPAPDHEDDPDNRIDGAYDYFHARVCGWAREVDEHERLARLEMLRVTVCDLLKVVSITLEGDDNAQVIFETLNARGTPLLALDLVKNAVFLEAARQGLNTDELYHEIWRPQLDDDYWRELRRQGRLNRPAGELFLMHWLTMKLKRVVPATELFPVFREQVLGAAAPPEIDQLIIEVCRDAATMRSFDTQQAGTAEATFFSRLDALDTSTVLPLVLLLFREPAIAPERRRRALQMIESWLVRRMIMGLTAKNYNQQIPVIVGRGTAEPERADEVLLEELRTGIGEISRWPTDEEITTQLTSRGMYGYISQPRLAMLLAAVEQSLYSNKGEALQVPKKLSIEHIMPQTWTTHWPLDLELAGEELTAAEAARNAHVHLIGNLTLTTPPLNSALQNAAWAAKQRELNTGSKLLLNAHLIDRYTDHFDEASIDERGEDIAKRVTRIWPGSTSEQWDYAARTPTPSAEELVLPAPEDDGICGHGLRR